MTREDVLPAALVSLGTLFVAQTAWMVVAPGSFFDAVGPFGARNDHYIRDMATWYGALGAAMLLLVARPTPARPGAAGALLLVALVQAALHTVNHVVDAGAADPGWVGVFDAATLAALTLGLVLLWRLDRDLGAPA